MSFLFGGAPPTVADMARRYKTDVNRQVRQLEREGQRLKNEEKALFVEMKRHANTNPKVAIQKAQAIVRTRQVAQRFATMEGHLQGVGAKITNMKSMDALSTTMAQVNAMMARFNAAPGMKNMAHVLGGFARENQALLLKSELMDDVLEDAFDENEQDECDMLVGDVLMEAGLEHLPMAVRSGAPPVVVESVEKKFEHLKVQANFF